MRRRKRGRPPKTPQVVLSILVNFRADRATLDAIDKLTAAYVPEPGDLSGGGKSRAIRNAILAAARRLK